MRLLKTALVPMLCLSLGLLVGCGQAPAQDDAVSQDDAPAAETVEPEPAMSNWTENSFYERPIPEIASDLELLGFELTDESFDDSDPTGEVTYFFATFEGTPEDNPVEGSDETVSVSLTYENPTFEEDAEERTCETIDQEALPAGATVAFYLPEADPSEYEAIARDVADAVGLGEFTDSSVGDPFETGRVIGNYTYQDTFKGVETESILVVSPVANSSSLPNPDMPLMVSYGPYVSSMS